MSSSWATPRIIVPLLVWPFALAIGMWLFFNVSPWLEERLRPVLVDQSVDIDPADRSPNQMCWTWRWVKVRNATPMIVAWTIHVNGTAVEYQLVTRRQRDGTVIRDVPPVPLGPGKNELCASIPSAIDKEAGLTIHGIINYRMPHGLWSLWQRLPPVPVPALPQDQ